MKKVCMLRRRSHKKGLNSATIEHIEYDSNSTDDQSEETDHSEGLHLDVEEDEIERRLHSMFG